MDTPAMKNRWMSFLKDDVEDNMCFVEKIDGGYVFIKENNVEKNTSNDIDCPTRSQHKPSESSLSKDKVSPLCKQLANKGKFGGSIADLVKTCKRTCREKPVNSAADLSLKKKSRSSESDLISETNCTETSGKASMQGSKARKTLAGVPPFSNRKEYCEEKDISLICSAVRTHSNDGFEIHQSDVNVDVDNSLPRSKLSNSSVSGEKWDSERTKNCGIFLSPSTVYNSHSDSNFTMVIQKFGMPNAEKKGDSIHKSKSNCMLDSEGDNDNFSAQTEAKKCADTFVENTPSIQPNTVEVQPALIHKNQNVAKDDMPNKRGKRNTARKSIYGIQKYPNFSSQLTQTLKQNVDLISPSFVSNKVKTTTAKEATLMFNDVKRQQESHAYISTKDDSTARKTSQNQLTPISFQELFGGIVNNSVVKKMQGNELQCPSTSKARKTIKGLDKCASFFSESTLNIQISRNSSEISSVQISKHVSNKVALLNDENKTENANTYNILRSDNLDKNDTQSKENSILPKPEDKDVAMETTKEEIRNKSILKAKQMIKGIDKYLTILNNSSSNIPSPCSSNEIKSPLDAKGKQVKTDKGTSNASLYDDEIRIVDVHLKNNNFGNIHIKKISSIVPHQSGVNNNNGSTKEVSKREVKISISEVEKNAKICTLSSRSVLNIPSHSNAYATVPLQEPKVIQGTSGEEISNVLLDDDDHDEIKIVDILMKNIPHTKEKSVTVAPQFNVTNEALQNEISKFILRGKKMIQGLSNPLGKLPSNFESQCSNAVSSPQESKISQVKSASSKIMNVPLFNKKEIGDGVYTKNDSCDSKINENTSQTKLNNFVITPQLGVTNDTPGKEPGNNRISRARKSFKGTGKHAVVQEKSTPSTAICYDLNKKLATDEIETRKGPENISKHSIIHVKKHEHNKTADIVKKCTFKFKKREEKGENFVPNLALNNKEHFKLNVTLALDGIELNQTEPSHAEITQRDSNNNNKDQCKPRVIKTNDSRFNYEVPCIPFNATVTQQQLNDKGATVKMSRTKKRNDCIPKAKKRLKEGNVFKGSVCESSKFNIKNFKLKPPQNPLEMEFSDVATFGKSAVKSINSTSDIEKKVEKNVSINKKHKKKNVPQPYATAMDKGHSFNKKNKKAARSNTIVKPGSGSEINDKYEQTHSGSKLNDESQYDSNETVIVQGNGLHRAENNSDSVSTNVPIFNSKKDITDVHKIIKNNQKLDSNNPSGKNLAKKLGNISLSTFEDALKTADTFKTILPKMMQKSKCHSEQKTTAPTQKLDTKQVDHAQNKTTSFVSVSNMKEDNDGHSISENYSSMFQEHASSNQGVKPNINEVNFENEALLKNNFLLDIRKKNTVNNEINTAPNYGTMYSENVSCNQQSVTNTITSLDRNVPTTKALRKNVMRRFILEAKKVLQENDDIDNYLYNSKLPGELQCTSNITPNVTETEHEDSYQVFSNSVPTSAFASIKNDDLYVKLKEYTCDTVSNQTLLPENILVKSNDLTCSSYDLHSQNANHDKYIPLHDRISPLESTCSKDFEKTLTGSESLFEGSSSSVEWNGKHFSNSLSFSKFSQDVTDVKAPSISTAELISILNNAAGCIVFQTGYDPNPLQGNSIASEEFSKETKLLPVSHLANDLNTGRENCTDLKELQVLKCAKQCARKMGPRNENETFAKSKMKQRKDFQKQITGHSEKDASSNFKLLSTEHKSSKPIDNLQHRKQSLSQKSLISSTSGGFSYNEISNSNEMQEISKIPIETSRSLSRLSNSSKSGENRKSPSREKRKCSWSKETRSREKRECSWSKKASSRERRKRSWSKEGKHREHSSPRSICSGRQMTPVSETSNVESANCSKLSNTSKSDNPPKPPLKKKEIRSLSRESKCHSSSRSRSRSRTSENITRKDRQIDSDISRQLLTEARKHRTSRSRSRERKHHKSSYPYSADSCQRNEWKSHKLSYSQNKSSSPVDKTGKPDNSYSRISHNSEDRESLRFEFARRRRYRSGRSSYRGRKFHSSLQSRNRSFSSRSRSPCSPKALAKIDSPDRQIKLQTTQESYSRRVIYVNYIPANYTTAELTHRFSSFGCVEDVNIMERRFCKDNNCAFITYKNPKHAVYAIKHGNDPPWEPKFFIQFGDQRSFRGNKQYIDPDKSGPENPLLKTGCSAEETDFDKLLNVALQRAGLPPTRPV